MKFLKLCTAAAAVSLFASTAFAGSPTIDSEGVLRLTVDDDFPRGAN